MIKILIYTASVYLGVGLGLSINWSKSFLADSYYHKTLSENPIAARMAFAIAFAFSTLTWGPIMLRGFFKNQQKYTKPTSEK